MRIKATYRFHVIGTMVPVRFDRDLHAGEPADVRWMTLDEVSNALGAGLTLKALVSKGNPYFPGEVLLPWNR